MAENTEQSQAVVSYDKESNELKRRRLLQSLQQGSLTDPADIKYFLKQFNKGQYPSLSPEDTDKLIRLIDQTSPLSDPDHKKLISQYKITPLVRLKRERLARKAKNNLDQILALKAMKDLELKAVQAAAYGTGQGRYYETKADGKSWAETVEETGKLIAARKSPAWKFWTNSQKEADRFMRRMREKIDPIEKEKRLRAELESTSGLRLLKKARLKLNLAVMPHVIREKAEKREAERQDKITRLENKIELSGWYRNWGSRLALRYHRWQSRSDQKIMIDCESTCQLDDRMKGLSAQKADLQAQLSQSLTRSQNRAATRKLNQLQKQLDYISLRQKEAAGRLDPLKKNIAARYETKILEQQRQMSERCDKIQVRGENRADDLLRGKALTKLMSVTGADKKPEVEALVQAYTQKEITADQEFRKQMEEAGIRPETLSKLFANLKEYRKEETTPNQKQTTADNPEPENMPEQTTAATEAQMTADALAEANAPAEAETPTFLLGDNDSLDYYRETLRKAGQDGSVDLEVADASDEFKAKVVLAAYEENLVLTGSEEELKNINLDHIKDEATRATLKEKWAAMEKKQAEDKYNRELLGNDAPEVTMTRAFIASGAIEATDRQYDELKKNNFGGAARNEQEMKDIDNLRTINEMTKLAKQAGLNPKALRRRDSEAIEKSFATAMQNMTDEEKKPFITVKDKYMHMSPEDEKRARTLGVKVKSLAQKQPEERIEIIKKTRLNLRDIPRSAGHE